MTRSTAPLIFSGKKRWIGMENRDAGRGSWTYNKRSLAERSR